MADTNFVIELEGFNEGYSPLAHIDVDTFIGNKGQATEMVADVISKPGFVTQAPSLATLTNGNDAGVVDELIRHILDEPVSSTVTYAIGTGSLFKLSSTTVASGGSPSWPQAISGMTEGESVIRMKENLFGFYNKSSSGDILAMPLSTEVIDPDWGSTTDQALEKAPHPSAVKEDILVFGNGRYLGVYIQGSAVLDVQKLDFGEGSIVADVVYNAGNWWIAVNSGQGKRSHVYLYDGSAISNILSDESGVGDQQIGFLYVLNGNVFIAYEDISSDGYSIGFISGRQIKPLRYFNGTLPGHRQKALYKNTIIFASGSNIMSFGASVEQLPLQISTLATVGSAAIGAIACPFGDPLVATVEDTDHVLSKFSGYSTNSSWKSRCVDVTQGRMLGKINDIIVYTKPLTENARCDVTLLGNQEKETSSAFPISGTDVTRTVIRSVDLPALEDLRILLDWSNGHASEDCPIRKIVIEGNFVER